MAKNDKDKTKNWDGEVRWIKISTNIFDDEKIKLIETMPEGDTILIIWFKLLIQAGLINNNGFIYLRENIPYTDEMLAVIFNRPINTIRLALQTFKKFGMIDIADTNEIVLLNWEKYQNLDKLERIREQGRIRVQKHREKQQKLLQNSCNVTCNGNVTQCNALEKEKEIEKEIEEDKLNHDSCSSSNNATTTTTNLNDDQKLYGEFDNVCLTKNEYNKMLGICMSQTLLNEIIEDLSCAIGRGKYPPYKADAPNAHFILLREFYNWRKKHPKNNDTESYDYSGVLNKWMNGD